MSDKLIGPFTFDVKVHVESQDERTIGAVTIGLAPGKVPTIEDIHRAIGQALAALPDGYTLLEGKDFFNRVLVKEKTGRIGNFATPASFRYDLAELETAARGAYQPEPEEVEESDEEDEDDEWLEDDE
jgi:hypothetical protein